MRQLRRFAEWSFSISVALASGNVRADSVRADGVRADGVRADGVRADGVRADGVRAEDSVSEECAARAENAQDLRSQHALRDAREQLLACAGTSCPKVIRNDCVQWLSEVEAALPSIVISAYYPTGADAIDVRVLVDGKELTNRLDGLALAMDPGIHTMRYELAAMRPVEERIVVRQGEKNRPLAVRFEYATVEPPSLPLPDTSSQNHLTPLMYALGGVGVVALGSFTYFGLQGKSEANTLAAGCGATKSCSNEQVDPVRTKLVVADVSLVVGLASLGVATYLFLSHRSSAHDRTPQSSALGVVGNQLRWAF